MGVTYDIDVQCSSPDPVALPLPDLHGAHVLSECFITSRLKLRCAGNITMGPCPPGTQVTVGMRFCEPCKGDDFNLVAGGICQPCPMGAKCTAGDRLEALPDWWCVRNHGVHQPLRSRSRRFCRRATNTSAVLFSCPMHSACESGADAGNSACAVGCVLACAIVHLLSVTEAPPAAMPVQSVPFAAQAITPGVRPSSLRSCMRRNDAQAPLTCVVTHQATSARSARPTFSGSCRWRASSQPFVFSLVSLCYCCALS